MVYKDNGRLRQLLSYGNKEKCLKILDYTKYAEIHAGVKFIYRDYIYQQHRIVEDSYIIVDEKKWLLTKIKYGI